MIQQSIAFLTTRGISPLTASIIIRSAATAAMLLLAIIAYIVATRLVKTILTHGIRSTSTDWDNILLREGVFGTLAHFIPAVIIIVLSPLIFDGSDRILAFISHTVRLYITFIIVLLVFRFTDAVHEIYQNYPVSKEIPIKGFLQIVKIAAVCIAFIVVAAILLNEKPLFILSGLGALTAVLLLIFKDSILGFVAGITLISNKMVAQGDWIEMPKYGADGDVMDVSLTTVKVRNWDKTITTIPTYALISDSFKNWQGMTESGGRRIKRAIYIDMSSIKFLNEEMLERFARIRYIREYLERKKEEVAEFNALEQVDDSSLVNGRRLTNIGTFRAYVTAYLRKHPQIRQDMTFLVRHLAPTEHGLPLEIYVFSADQVWANYEAIQADIFDHLLAVAPEFDLRVFQAPSGNDFRSALGSASGDTPHGRVT